MRRDEIDAVVRQAATGLIEVARAGQTGRHGPGHAEIASPVAADVIAVVAVPLGPPLRGERADLKRASRVPGLGNDLCVGEHGVFGDQLDHRRIGHQLALPVAAENRRQIEAEAVDVIVVHPMPQAMEDHLADDRVVAVDGIAAAGVVLVAAVVVQHVKDFVFESLETERRALLVAFGRVVEDDVENHLDAVGMQFADHLLELPHLVARRGAFHVAAVGREEGHRVVAPIVRSFALGTVALLGGKFVDRHQLDRRDAKRFQVRDLLDNTLVGARMIHLARGALSEAANVHLVDDRLGERALKMAIATPIEVVVDHDALGRASDAVVAWQESARQCSRVRIDQSRVGDEALSIFRIEWPVGLEVVELPGSEPGDEHAPNVAPAVARRFEFDDPVRFEIVDAIVQQHAHRRRRAAKDDELDPAIAQHRAVWQRIGKLGPGGSSFFARLRHDDKHTAGKEIRSGCKHKGADSCGRGLGNFTGAKPPSRRSCRLSGCPAVRGRDRAALTLRHPPQVYFNAVSSYRRPSPRRILVLRGTSGSTGTTRRGVRVGGHAEWPATTHIDVASAWPTTTCPLPPSAFPL